MATAFETEAEAKFVSDLMVKSDAHSNGRVESMLVVAKHLFLDRNVWLRM